MTFAECLREQDVVNAIATGRWPDRCDEDLAAHVAACEGCRDLASTLGVLSESWADARAGARLPAAGTVWWRAQVRARQEAARAATRPLTVAQIIGGTIAAALALAVLVYLAPWLSASLRASRAFLAFDVPVVAAGWVMAISAAVALMSLVSLAVYLIVAED